MLETPVYVAVLDNYTLLSENLTTADNQQESPLDNLKPKMIKTVTSRIKRVLSHDEKYTKVVEGGGNFPRPRLLTEDELKSFIEGMRYYNREQKEKLLVSYKERFG